MNDGSFLNDSFRLHIFVFLNRAKIFGRPESRSAVRGALVASQLFTWWLDGLHLDLTICRDHHLSLLLKISLVSLALFRIKRRSPLPGARWLLLNFDLLLIEPMLSLYCLLRRDLWGNRLKELAPLLYRGRGAILSQVSFGNFETGFLLGCLLLSRLVGEGPCLVLLPHH